MRVALLIRRVTAVQYDTILNPEHPWLPVRKYGRSSGVVSADVTGGEQGAALEKIAKITGHARSFQCWSVRFRPQGWP